MILSEHKEQNHTLPELLSPAGTLSHLKAAINAGADAVYIGGSRFGARAYAGNFEGEDIEAGISYAHFYGKKIYLTVNTLMKEHEVEEELFDFLLPYEEAGLDGVIVQDLGTASFIRQVFPKIALHGSTQMTVTDVYGALAAKESGMIRIVPARELSLAEILAIKERTGLEVEVFAHGALCYCYSGQCLLSSASGKRSGNRGRCAQPCRLPYEVRDINKTLRRKNQKNPFALSPKDLCALSILPELAKAGIDSLKIEGRMKNEHYVAGVTAIYRHYLDHLTKHPDPEDVANLEELYCRGTFTDGYFHRHNGKEMMSTKSPKNTGHQIGKIKTIRRGEIEIEHSEPLNQGDILVIYTNNNKEVVLTVPMRYNRFLKAPDTASLNVGQKVYRRRKAPLIKSLEERYLQEPPSLPAQGRFLLKSGRPASLTLTCRDRQVTLTGDIPEPSQNKPVTQEDLRRQLSKTGNVPFTFTKLSIEMEDGLFLPMSKVNQMRREAFETLSEQLKMHRPVSINRKNAILPKTRPIGNRKPALYTVIYDEAQLCVCLENPVVAGIILPKDHLTSEEMYTFFKKIRENGKKCFLSMERILRQGGDPEEDAALFSLGFDGIYVHTLNHLMYLTKKFPKQRIFTGPSVYHWNTRSEMALAELSENISGMEVSLELCRKEIAETTDRLNCPEGRNIEQELLIYGQFPVMVSAQCLKATYGGCNHRPERLTLRKNQEIDLPVTTHCRWCYNTIWHKSPRNLIGDDFSTFYSRFDRFRIDGFGMDSGQFQKILASFEDWKESGYLAMPHYVCDDPYWTSAIE